MVKNPPFNNIFNSKDEDFDSTCSDSSSKEAFSFPPVYDRAHRICFTVETDDLEYQLRVLQQKREDERKRRESPCRLFQLMPLYSN